MSKCIVCRAEAELIEGLLHCVDCDAKSDEWVRNQIAQRLNEVKT
jgi:hypothetical protein